MDMQESLNVIQQAGDQKRMEAAAKEAHEAESLNELQQKVRNLVPDIQKLVQIGDAIQKNHLYTPDDEYLKIDRYKSKPSSERIFAEGLDHTTGFYHTEIKERLLEEYKGLDHMTGFYHRKVLDGIGWCGGGVCGPCDVCVDKSGKVTFVNKNDYTELTNTEKSYALHHFIKGFDQFQKNVENLVQSFQETQDYSKEDTEKLDRLFASYEKDGMSTRFFTSKDDPAYGKFYKVLRRATPDEMARCNKGGNPEMPWWLVQTEKSDKPHLASPHSICPDMILKTYGRSIQNDVIRVPFHFENGCSLHEATDELDRQLATEETVLRQKLAQLQEARTQLHMQSTPYPFDAIEKYRDIMTPMDKTSWNDKWPELKTVLKNAREEQESNETHPKHARISLRALQDDDLIAKRNLVGEPVVICSNYNYAFSKQNKQQSGGFLVKMIDSPENPQDAWMSVPNSNLVVEQVGNTMEDAEFSQYLNETYGLLSKSQLEKVDDIIRIDEERGKKRTKTIEEVFSKAFRKTFKNKFMENPDEIKAGTLATATEAGTQAVVQAFGKKMQPQKLTEKLEPISPAPIRPEYLRQNAIIR